MRATEVLQKCLEDALGSMHALRSRVLLRAVEATIHGRRLTLIDLARSWPEPSGFGHRSKPWIACCGTVICMPSIKAFMPRWRVGWCAANSR